MRYTLPQGSHQETLLLHSIHYQVGNYFMETNTQIQRKQIISLHQLRMNKISTSVSNTYETLYAIYFYSVHLKYFILLLVYFLFCCFIVLIFQKAFCFFFHYILILLFLSIISFILLLFIESQFIMMKRKHGLRWLTQIMNT